MKKSPILVFLFAALIASTPAADAPPFGSNIQPRGSLANSWYKFHLIKKGRVAFMGGSITEMNGYRPMVCGILKKRFPATEFTFIDAGIASTCSTTGAFRLESDVLSKGTVDLLFVEFAVNDDQDAAHTRAECIRGMEGIFRHCWKNNPNMDIVAAFFVNEGMLKTFESGKTPLTIEAHEAVAEHYSISTINLAKEVSEQMAAGKLTWKQYGGVHPAKFGNAICASMIDELFERAFPHGAYSIIPDLRAHTLPAAPLDPLNYESGRFIEPTNAVIKSGWTLAVPVWKQLPGSTRERFTSIPMLCATEPGAEMSLEFEGTAVGAYIVAGPDAGIAEASIDGGPFAAVNLFHHFSSGLHYPRTVMLGTDLKPGKHTLVLKMSNETKSKGHAMRIMEFTPN